MDVGKVMRTGLIGSSSLLAIVAIFVIQSKFDGLDRKNAVELVQRYRSRTGWTVPELLDKKHPGEAANWEVKTQSSCQQHEKVTVAYPTATYEFMVNINGPSLHPGNQASESIMSGLDTEKPVAPPAASGSGSAAPAAGSAAAPPSSASAPASASAAPPKAAP